jgi:hypothetical protein
VRIKDGHSKDLDSLYLIQRFFGVGNVTMHGSSAMFQVIRLSDLARVIEHFNKYPLKTASLREASRPLQGVGDLD